MLNVPPVGMVTVLSRKVQPVPAPRFSQIDEIGALDALVGREVSGTTLPQLVTSDPLGAFQRVAREHRREFHGTIVGVTGSVGKTSTKDLLALLLGGAPDVLATAGATDYQFFKIVGLVGAFMTACYMTRCVYLTFFGEYRGGHDDVSTLQRLYVPPGRPWTLKLPVIPKCHVTCGPGPLSRQ